MTMRFSVKVDDERIRESVTREEGIAQITDYVASEVMAKIAARGTMKLSTLRTSITVTTEHSEGTSFTTSARTIFSDTNLDPKDRVFSTSPTVQARERHVQTTMIPPSVVDAAIQHLLNDGRLEQLDGMVYLPGVHPEDVLVQQNLSDEVAFDAILTCDPRIRRERYFNYDSYIRNELGIEPDTLSHKVYRQIIARLRLNAKGSWTELHLAPVAPLPDPEELHASEKEDAYLAEGKTVDIREILTIESPTKYAVEVRAPVPASADTSFDGELSLTALTRYEATTPEQAQANSRRAYKAYIHAWLQTPEGQRWSDLQALKVSHAYEMAPSEAELPVSDHQLPDEDDDVFSVAFDGPVASRAKQETARKTA